MPLVPPVMRARFPFEPVHGATYGDTFVWTCSDCTPRNVAVRIERSAIGSLGRISTPEVVSVAKRQLAAGTAVFIGIHLSVPPQAKLYKGVMNDVGRVGSGPGHQRGCIRSLKCGPHFRGDGARHARCAHGRRTLARTAVSSIRTGNIVQISRALDSGISARAVDGNGTPALMSATLFCDAAVVKLLLDRGADPNATNKAGATALMWAIPELTKVKLLVARGANVNARSGDLGRTPLLVAAGYPNTADILRVLVRKGADIKAKDKEGMHALGRAVLHADVENVRFLVENGSDMSDRSGFGEFGLGLYFVGQDLQIAEYLLSQGMKVGKEALAIAPGAKSVTLLDRMLAAGADVNAPIKVLKSTPLLMATAAEQTRPDSLRWLLDKGADPNVEGTDGDRALDWASYRADQNRIDLLKRYGAKPGTVEPGQSRILCLRALTTPTPRWKRVWRCYFRLGLRSSRPEVALHVITNSCRCMFQRRRARKEYLSTNGCWKRPESKR